MVSSQNKKTCLLLFFIIVTFTSLIWAKDFYVNGTLYQDYMGFSAGENHFYQRLSTRLKLSLWNKPGSGWTLGIDMRNRFTPGEKSSNQFILYDVKAVYDKAESKFYFSLGQMNLYDTSGIGQLTGGLAGFKLNRDVSIGGYLGIEPDIYNSKWDMAYQKFGLFFRYLGAMARQFALSYHRLHYSGDTERQHLYTTLLFPVKKWGSLYACAEYELDGKVEKEDRLSHMFLNARLNLSKYFDVTAHYSSGRGLDYHRFLLEYSQNPTIGSQRLERFYYQQSIGVRLSVKPVKNWRVFYANRRSEHMDEGIINHTTQLGASAVNLLKTGISVFGYYNINNGDASESDTFSINCSRSFGRLSLGLGYSNFYSGVKSSVNGEPQIIYKTNQHTFLLDLFYSINRSVAVSAEYALTSTDTTTENQFYIRLIYRKRPRYRKK